MNHNSTNDITGIIRTIRVNYFDIYDYSTRKNIACISIILKNSEFLNSYLEWATLKIY